MQDYRSNYIASQAKNETFTLEIKGDRFVFKGSAGTDLEMRPILPSKIEVDQGDSVMVITKNKMIIRNKREKAEQLKMEMGDNGNQ